MRFFLQKRRELETRVAPMGRDALRGRKCAEHNGRRLRVRDGFVQRPNSRRKEEIWRRAEARKPRRIEARQGTLSGLRRGALDHVHTSEFFIASMRTR